MPAKPTSPAERRGLPRWARVFLCVGLVPVIVLAPLVVLGMWPGLRFDLYKEHTFLGRRMAFGIQRGSTADGSMLGIGAGVFVLAWERRYNPATPFRMLNPGRAANFEQTYFAAEKNCLVIIRRRNRGSY